MVGVWADPVTAQVMITLLEAAMAGSSIQVSAVLSVA
jgi:hypothetical protein